MKDMSAVYSRMPSDQLRTLKSKKYVQHEKLIGALSFFDQMERLKLKRQIMWIDAVLASRNLQLPLL